MRHTTTNTNRIKKITAIGLIGLAFAAVGERSVEAASPPQAISATIVNTPANAVPVREIGQPRRYRAIEEVYGAYGLACTATITAPANERLVIERVTASYIQVNDSNVSVYIELESSGGHDYIPIQTFQTFNEISGITFAHLNHEVLVYVEPGESYTLCINLAQVQSSPIDTSVIFTGHSEFVAAAP
jgi:hypothetical protein